MVAAHLGDLRAAKALGLRTAFVARPLEFGPNGKPDLKADASVESVRRPTSTTSRRSWGPEMLNRRAFLAAAAAAAWCNRASASPREASSISPDPRRTRHRSSLRLDAVRDVASRRPHRAVRGQSRRRRGGNHRCARQARRPGLIDIHTHAARPPRVRRWCCRTASPAGSTRDRRAPTTSPTSIAIARSAPQQGRVLINIGRAGILPEGDTMDLARADVGRGARRDREEPRLHRRREGAAVARRRGRERLRGAAARAGSGVRLSTCR